MSRRIEGHAIPPHDYCTACLRGDSTRMISIAGDREWLAMAYEVITGHDGHGDHMVNVAWPHLREYADDKRHWLIRLCRACAERARDGLPADRPTIYSAAKIKRGEYIDRPLNGIYQPPEPVVLPASRAQVAALVHAELSAMVEHEMRPGGSVQTMLKERRGMTLCCFIHPENGERAYYVTDNPELVDRDGPNAANDGWLCDEPGWSYE
jgi:hypothetical protein